jgi:hypothetical protein
MPLRRCRKPLYQATQYFTLMPHARRAKETKTEAVAIEGNKVSSPELETLNLSRAGRLHPRVIHHECTNRLIAECERYLEMAHGRRRNGLVGDRGMSALPTGQNAGEARLVGRQRARCACAQAPEPEQGYADSGIRAHTKKP